jgi:hypothetical protein
VPSRQVRGPVQLNTLPGPSSSAAALSIGAAIGPIKNQQGSGPKPGIAGSQSSPPPPP